MKKIITYLGLFLIFIALLFTYLNIVSFSFEDHILFNQESSFMIYEPDIKNVYIHAEKSVVIIISRPYRPYSAPFNFSVYRMGDEKPIIFSHKEATGNFIYDFKTEASDNYIFTLETENYSRVFSKYKAYVEENHSAYLYYLLYIFVFVIGIIMIIYDSKKK